MASYRAISNVDNIKLAKSQFVFFNQSYWMDTQLNHSKYKIEKRGTEDKNNA